MNIIREAYLHIKLLFFTAASLSCQQQTLTKRDLGSSNFIPHRRPSANHTSEGPLPKPAATPEGSVFQALAEPSTVNQASAEPSKVSSTLIQSVKPSSLIIISQCE